MEVVYPVLKFREKNRLSQKLRDAMWTFSGE
jgi:hypothetical protein